MNRSAPSIRQVPPGFTLIELLTVVAIIGILAAILIPVASRVREQARRSACGSNLRQLTIAIHHFANDNDDRLPRVTDGFSGAAETIVADPHHRNTGLGTLVPDYLDALEVFWCMTSELSNHAGGLEAQKERWRTAGLMHTTYVYRGRAGTAVDGETPPRVPNLPHFLEHRLSIITDKVERNYGRAWDPPGGGLYTNHPGGFNVARADGSVRWLEVDSDTTAWEADAALFFTTLDRR